MVIVIAKAILGRPTVLREPRKFEPVEVTADIGAVGGTADTLKFVFVLVTPLTARESAGSGDAVPKDAEDVLETELTENSPPDSPSGGVMTSPGINSRRRK